MNGTVQIALHFAPQRLRDGHIQPRWRATLAGPVRVEGCGLSRQEALANLGLRLDIEPVTTFAAEPAVMMKLWSGLQGLPAPAVETAAPPASVEVGGAKND